jgi:hypothetical protein
LASCSRPPAFSAALLVAANAAADKRFDDEFKVDRPTLEAIPPELEADVGRVRPNPENAWNDENELFDLT